MPSILFICLGNICRSPLAEGLFLHHARRAGVAERFTVDSAGIIGGSHAGRPPHRGVCALARRAGIELRGGARQIERDDFERFDHLICMDEENREWLLANGAPPHKVRLLLECAGTVPRREVPDPMGCDEAVFETVYELIDGACEALVEELG